MKEIVLGLIGFGNIGSGVVKLLRDNREHLERRLGASVRLKKVADLDITTPRVVPVEREKLTTDAGEILRDPEISIVIELIGGYEPARSFIIEAMRNKKHVVTANKALLATHGNEIFEIAEREGVDIGFEASVGGTIPIIKTLKESLVANRIKSIFGIMNGTSNFILTKMTDEGKAFDDVLKDAQRLGFAEADPTFDIEGIDTAHKLAITLALSYGKKVRLEDIYREGISGIEQKDIEFARELGYRIKLLAIAIQRKEGAIEARIHPTMIPFDHLLANVNGNFNAFHVVGDASDSIFLYGQGSGMMPTASAVMSDIIDIGRDIMKGIARRVPSRAHSEYLIENISLLPMDDIETRYYFRFSAVDRPGVLSKISGILGENNISIASVIQKGRKLDGAGAVPVVMTTHESKEANVRMALQRIDELDIVKGKTVRIRIEDEKLQ
ncbi:MAG: homoserine dehydrogenase [Syntrophales bacterium]